MPSFLQMLAAPIHDKTALKIFQELRNGVSDTEWAALSAGTAGFEASLFSGKPDWQGLGDTPPPGLTAEEQSFLDNEVEQLCTMVDDWKVREELHDLPAEVYDFMKKAGFFGLIIPKEYGGKDFSAQAHSAIVGKLNSRSNTLAVTAMVPNSLGPAELLMNYGTQEQKDHYLPRLAKGDDIPCFALTSETAGSDATSMTDNGVAFKDENGDLQIKLNWAKRYITLAPVATLFGLAYKLRVPKALIEDVRDNPDQKCAADLKKMLKLDDALEGAALSAALQSYADGLDPKSGVADLGITLSLLPADSPGLDRGLRHRPGGSAFHNGPHWGHDVVAPAGSIIGGPAKAGHGWNMLVDCLSVGRSISLPATAAGGLKYLSRVTGAYAAVRNQFGYADEGGQFGMSLAQMEGVQEYLTRIAGLTYMVDAARILPLQELDISHEARKHDKSSPAARPAVASAILKYNTTEFMAHAAMDAMAVHGGKGVVLGPNNPVATVYQASPIGQTVEGANSLTRTMITFGQGAFLVHPFTMKQMKAAEQNDSRAAGWLIKRHVAHIFNHHARSFLNAFGLDRLTHSPHKGPDAKYYRDINRLSSNFVVLGNATMLLLQKGLKSKQRLSGRLADTLSNMYMAAQVLRRWDLEGRKEADRPLMEWCCKTALYNAEKAMIDVLDNFPSKLIGKFLKATVFPLGPRQQEPSDRLNNQVARIITTPGEARDRLTAGIFIPQGEKEYVARLERAFALAYEAGPVEAKLARGLKKEILTPETDKQALVQQAVDKGVLPAETDVAATAKLLADTRDARQDIIAVDAFPHEWTGAPVNPHGPVVP